MKILYGIQGTGNGHISRSKEIIRELQQKSEVDVLISGSLYEMDLGFEVKYRKKGTGGWFDNNGGVDYWGLYRNTNFSGMIKDIIYAPVKEYDLIVSDFEPITAWSSKCYGIPSIHVSHEIALADNGIPKPRAKSFVAEVIIKYFAPCKRWLGFHYQNYNERIFTPIIRREIRELNLSEGDHYIIHLSSYDPFKFLNSLNSLDVKFEIFSKYYTDKNPVTKYNVTIYPFEKELFLERLSSCSGVICNSGFQLTSETLFLGKKMLVIPMKGQYEQLCNAVALKELGAEVLYSIDGDFGERLNSWIKSATQIEKMDYPDVLQDVVNTILDFNN